MATLRTLRCCSLVVIVCLALAQVGCAARGANPAVSVDDQADIYALAIRAIAFELPSGELREPPGVTYLVRTTNDRTAELRHPEQAGEALSPEVQERVSAALADLESSHEWVDTFGTVAWEDGHVEGFGQIVEVTRLDESESGTHSVGVSLTYGTSGAYGETYVVRKVDGEWQIVDVTGPSAISMRTGLTRASSRLTHALG